MKNAYKLSLKGARKNKIPHSYDSYVFYYQQTRWQGEISTARHSFLAKYKHADFVEAITAAANPDKNVKVLIEYAD